MSHESGAYERARAKTPFFQLMSMFNRNNIVPLAMHYEGLAGDLVHLAEIVELLLE